MTIIKMRADSGESQPSNATQQGETMRLRNGQLEAVCELWRRRIGWEVRLVVGGRLLRGRACKNREQVLRISERWRAAMLDAGWREWEPETPLLAIVTARCSGLFTDRVNEDLAR